MENVTVQSVQKTHKEFLGSIFLDIYAYGNYAPEKINVFAKEIRNIMGPSTQLKHHRYIPDFKSVPGTARMKKVSISKDGVGILDNYVYPEKSKKITAQLSLINKLYRPTFFNELRTNQEVGYIASSFSSETNEYPTLSTIIVSDSNNLAELKEKVMGFNYGFAVAFENLSNKTIENTKKAMIEELEKEAENIFVEASVYLDDWNDGNYKFDSNQTTINHIKNTTKDDLVALMNQIFLQGQYMNTTVQIRGEDFKDTPFFNW
jgi:protease-3